MTAVNENVPYPITQCLQSSLAVCTDSIDDSLPRLSWNSRTWNNEAIRTYFPSIISKANSVSIAFARASWRWSSLKRWSILLSLCFGQWSNVIPHFDWINNNNRNTTTTICGCDLTTQTDKQKGKNNKHSEQNFAWCNDDRWLIPQFLFHLFFWMKKRCFCPSCAVYILILRACSA